jgi:hypothetical protein
MTELEQMTLEEVDRLADVVAAFDDAAARSAKRGGG